MKKNEIIILVCFLALFISMLVSYVYTCYQLKPKGNEFRIEKCLKQTPNNPTNQTPKILFKSIVF